ncbi:unnamed protein product [Ectocarpus sp. 4 AP-2014]
MRIRLLSVLVRAGGPYGPNIERPWPFGTWWRRRVCSPPSTRCTPFGLGAPPNWRRGVPHRRFSVGRGDGGELPALFLELLANTEQGRYRMGRSVMYPVVGAGQRRGSK